jgi:transposase-like protein
MKRSRKHLSGPEKLAILKRYLVEKVPISNLCDEHQLQPSQLYNWQAQLFEHGAAVFERKPGRPAKQVADAKDRKIAQLEAAVAQKEAKLAKKDEVIVELMQEHVQLKKELGEP